MKYIEIRRPENPGSVSRIVTYFQQTAAGNWFIQLCCACQDFQWLGNLLCLGSETDKMTIGQSQYGKLNNFKPFQVKIL